MQDKRISDLSGTKQQLLAELLKKKRARIKAFQEKPVSPVSRDFYPLSFVQERIWFIEKLYPGNITYNMAGIAEVKGPFDRQVLVQGFREVVARHEVLRSVFVEKKGKPMAEVLPELSFDVPEHDITSFPEMEKGAEIERIVKEYTGQPFDLEQGPLFRLVFIITGEERFLVLLVVHHIASDGWSTKIIFEETIAYCDAVMGGGRPEYTPLGIQYYDYSTWQREGFQEEVLSHYNSYWKKQLEGASFFLEFAAGSKTPEKYTHQGKRIPLLFSPELTASLLEFSKKQEVTLFQTLFSGVNALLYLYTRQDDICLGIPVAGRNRREVMPLVGCFVNVLVIRSRFSGSASFKELLTQAKNGILEGYKFQEMPFESLVQEFYSDRDLNVSPLVQFIFSYEENPLKTRSFRGVELSFGELDNGTSRFELELELELDGDTLKGWMNYNTDIFDEYPVKQFLEHYRILLGELIRDPSRPLSEYKILSEEAKRQVVEDFNSSAYPFEADKTIPDLFSRQALRLPGKAAL